MFKVYKKSDRKNLEKTRNQEPAKKTTEKTKPENPKKKQEQKKQKITRCAQ
jgi:hypothetical protein